MPKQSKFFYARITGDRALFTNPITKGGGEKYSYPIPTKQALEGIVDNVYRKPTFTNVVDEVKVINPIQTEVHGIRALLSNYKADLNYISYLSDVEYLIKFHFEWDFNRGDLTDDRKRLKHEEIMERSLELGGRSSDTMGMKHYVEHATYVIKGSISPNLAEVTGFTEEDAEYIKQALLSLFENDQSSARPDGSMTVRNLYWFTHSNKLGNASSARVYDLVHFDEATDEFIVNEDKLSTYVQKGLKLDLIEGF